jgi:cytochrome bd-type quinol oxidase subunit 1
MSFPLYSHTVGDIAVDLLVLLVIFSWFAREESIEDLGPRNF